MDRERAKFVLRSFRPDGADAVDADFAEALQMATGDRELGEWLMRERAFDAEFAEALARVDLPEGLREGVLLAMVRGEGGFPRVDQEGEREIIVAMAGIAVPPGLRGRILEAMEQTAKVQRESFGWKRFGIPLAAAAGVALAFVFVDGSAPAAGNTAARPITVKAVQAGFVRTFESPIFSLDREDEKPPQLMSYLRGKGLPCGKGYLPPGLIGVKGLGCRELVIDGKRGSLLCFDEAGGTVHLVIFRKKDVGCKLPGMASPMLEQDGHWAEASWCSGDFVFVLLGMRDKESLAAMF
ncbi:hypothetical protein HZ994_05085 [Akkermansiaceae bacterium]|nr:hypothetical protein HZ994_05085 [Akkermansiaceae bacterium]